MIGDGTDDLRWLKIWQDRKGELDKRLDELKTEIERHEDQALLKTNMSIINSLKDFIEIIFTFCKDAEKKRRENGKPQNDDEPIELSLNKEGDEAPFHVHTYSNLGYQPSFLLDSVLEQASIDISRLEAAVAQQQENSHKIPLAKFVWNRSSVLVPIMDDPPPTPSPYLTYRFEVRLLPYSDTPMIGIPYTAYANRGNTGDDSHIVSSDFMAIPHEVGHLVFRNGRILNEKKGFQEILENAISEEKNGTSIPLWAMEWLEEIFADTYGCFIANSLSIVGLHNMLANSSPNRVFVSSHNYPLPALRPLIQIKILKMLHAHETVHSQQDSDSQQSEIEFETEIKTLDDAWNSVAQNLWGIQDLNQHFFVVDGIPMRGEYIVRTATRIAKIIINHLNSFQTPPRLGDPIPVDYKVGEAELHVLWKPDQLHPQHEIMVKTAAEKATESIEIESEAGTKFRWLQEELKRVQDRTTGEVGSITIDELVDVILFNGWSDEGPKVGPGGG